MVILVNFSSRSNMVFKCKIFASMSGMSSYKNFYQAGKMRAKKPELTRITFYHISVPFFGHVYIDLEYGFLKIYGIGEKNKNLLAWDVCLSKIFASR